MRQKAEDANYKQKLLDEIENEKNLRLGDRYKAPEKKVLSPSENVKLGI